MVSGSVQRSALSATSKNPVATESLGAMPGDTLTEGPVRVGTNTIDIASDRGLVFDFLAQKGSIGAGWYSSRQPQNSTPRINTS